MKLTINQPFELEYNEDVFTGTVRELTKAESKQLKAESKIAEVHEKKLNKLNKKKARANADIQIAEKLEEYEKLTPLLDKLEEIEDEIETLNENFDYEENLQTILRKRFDITVKSDKIQEIKKLAEDFGYQLVLATIAKGAEEKKPKE